MTSENLDNLVRIGQLKAEPSADNEVAGLIQSGLTRLKDSQNMELGYESRFDLAYNAAHALSLAALRLAGYRSETRYHVFLCTKHTIDLENERWRVLENSHNKRNLAEYEGSHDVDEQTVEALIRVAIIVAERVQELVK
ncbi:MAG: hypothetical protein OEM30_06265 [Gammaproteobacteria bacterium]|jgi:hypothetical protein|nr:hypothetical protein [Gammaproteobacteria bacterium]